MAEKAARPSDLLSRMHKTFGQPAPIVTTPVTAEEEPVAAPVEESHAAEATEAPATPRPARAEKPRARAKREPKSRERKKAIPTPEETIRFSLDLDPDEHRQMKLFAIDNGVKASVVGRVLVEMLNNDPTIADRVASRLEQLRQS